MAADYMVRDRIQDLWQQIDRLHLTYLHTDESPRKIDEKKRLEGYIREFLCVAQHEQKFFFRETSEVLHRSIESKEDFSAYRATAAWTAIAAYAHNLLAQPWRKQFHEIKTYCGYYKHNLESNLVGAELMLEAMGYKHTGRSTMVLDGPVDPDRVTMVSRDSIAALVECQIIRSIYAEVVKVLPTCTWLEVLQYRETHICTPELAVRGLTYRLHQRRYEEQQYRNQMENYNTVARYHHPIDHCPYAARYHYNYTLPNPRYGVVSPQQPMPPPYPIYHIKPHEVYGGSYYPVQNGYIPLPVPPPPLVMSNYSCSVPTAQLIELDPPHDPPIYNPNTHRRSSSDHRVEHDARKNGERYPSDMYSRSTTSDDLGSRKSGKNKECNWESWGYVYQRLEEKNGGKKREEAVVEKKKEHKRPPSPMDLDDALKAFSLDDLHQLTVPEQRPLKINEALSKLRLDSDGDTKKKENRVSLYDNSSPPASSSPKQMQSISRDMKKPEDSKLTETRKLRVKLIDKWDCVACTFQNSGGKDICEMCGKSRSKGGESKPLASGGRQCPQCTLVNEKGVTKCEACDTSLKDSPTYI
uniref:RanBP2-type domain-containing protein n=1 Tax=Cuerna arida TaxID=1464854 RepID=A0A1B6G7C1_9HEMI